MSQQSASVLPRNFNDRKYRLATACHHRGADGIVQIVAEMSHTGCCAHPFSRLPWRKQTTPSHCWFVMIAKHALRLVILIACLSYL